MSDGAFMATLLAFAIPQVAWVLLACSPAIVWGVIWLTWMTQRPFRLQELLGYLAYVAVIWATLVYLSTGD